jgi:hypothetical protein
MDTYYNNKIQLDKLVIKDVFDNIKPNTKMLVFGLGFDSKMWYEGNNKNTFFVENKNKYINLNKYSIPASNIIKYDYKITLESSETLTNKDIYSFIIPKELLDLAPFDIIIIDGPEGYAKEKPGRLIPCYWSTILSNIGTIIYIDDSSRRLETFCIKKYFSNNKKDVFKERGECTKIYV